ncbi:MAG: DUF2281 domain-containing protein [Microcystis sp.]|jgi:hypothetical protein|uniref:type II toxin-antitoxin system VapB family antitoxin n=1 Tax=unclassified Microcystis TaxID=2643300 RepID=UPI0022BADB7F|nr:MULTISPECIES: DUF2281 domain-containing protein [unclassified Microcystis]MCE2671130.1 DUF2281 domain-containing protein [Microcystis sp. 49638_E5]MCZ8055994.1 DUF2281 domain-containing protein [Microcystis sp. LE19-12.2C]MDJ0550260.1 DUF2281 domain-containing protein [Microcystis sp. M49637_WE12]MDJ0587119.1 DUF2281 domain-containing protein [Microcystis sp. M49636_WE2]
MTISGNKITESIINKLQEIPLDKQKQILEYVEALTEEKEPSSSQKKRVFGLHQGKIWMSDDFNQPLPDNFWNFDS